MRTPKQDPLLGVQHRNQPAGGGSRATLIAAALAALVLIAGAAFLLGMYSAGQNPPPAPAPASAATTQLLVPPKAPPAAPAAAIAKAPAKPTQLAISLAAVTEADQEKLGIGCACSFGRTNSSKSLFIAGGDNLAIWRPNGKRKVCPLGEEQLQEMFDDAATIQCGSSRIVIRGRGKVDPGFDGHGRTADLTVFEDGNETKLKGYWGCQC